MATLKQIQAEIKKLNKKEDGISDALIGKLEEYQKEYERLLQKKKFDLDEDGKLKRTTKNYNKAQKLDPMDELGFNKIAISHVEKYDEVADNQIKFNKRIGIKTDLDFRDVTIIKQFKNTDLANMFGEGAQLDALIKKQLVNAIALNADYQKTVENLAKDLLGSGLKGGKLARHSNTYMRTSLLGMSRSIDKEIYDRLGEDKFIYAGPVQDKRIRPFCARHVGKTYTREEIEQFPVQNGSGLDGFFSPGGWNCRHRMVPDRIVEEKKTNTKEMAWENLKKAENIEFAAKKNFKAWERKNLEANEDLEIDEEVDLPEFVRATKEWDVARKNLVAARKAAGG